MSSRNIVVLQVPGTECSAMWILRDIHEAKAVFETIRRAVNRAAGIEQEEEKPDRREQKEAMKRTGIGLAELCARASERKARRQRTAKKKTPRRKRPSRAR